MTRSGKRSILLLNGPNINLLGTREPHVYGSDTLENVVARARKQVEDSGHHFDTFQSNWEGAMIDRIHAARTDGTDAIVINPVGLTSAAWTHTSVALRDAILGIEVKFVELHVSNVHAREQFRHHSYFSDVAVAVMMGFGVAGYSYAIDFVLNNTAKFPPRPEAAG